MVVPRLYFLDLQARCPRAGCPEWWRWAVGRVATGHSCPSVHSWCNTGTTPPVSTGICGKGLLNAVRTRGPGLLEGGLMAVLPGLLLRDRGWCSMSGRPPALGCGMGVEVVSWWRLVCISLIFKPVVHGLAARSGGGRRWGVWQLAIPARLCIHGATPEPPHQSPQASVGRGFSMLSAPGDRAFLRAG